MTQRSPNPDGLAKQIVASDGSQGLAGGSATAATPFPRPESCGDFDIRIDRDGKWYYQESPIDRPSLVKLFASVLRRDEEGGYWLVTPSEAGRIRVEDAPFTAVEVSVSGEGRQRIVTMRTNLDDIVTVGADHPIRVEHAPRTGEPAPYVRVRDGLEARILRPVFYHLVDHGEERRLNGRRVYGVWSRGEFFPLGNLAGDA